MDQSSSAHRTGFESYIQRRPVEAVVCGAEGGCAEGADLGMGGRIETRNGRIVFFRKHFVASDEDRTHRYFSGLFGRLRKP